MKALLFQLLFLSAFVVVAAAIAVLRANASGSGLRSDSDTIPAAIEEERGVGANERELFYYRQYSQEPTSSCDALYFRYMSGETQSLLRSVCTYSGLVQYKLGDISTISNNRPVSTAVELLGIHSLHVDQPDLLKTAADRVGSSQGRDPIDKKPIG